MGEGHKYNGVSPGDARGSLAALPSPSQCQVSLGMMPNTFASWTIALVSHLKTLPHPQQGHQRWVFGGKDLPGCSSQLTMAVPWSEMGGGTVALHHSHYCDGLLLQTHWMLHQEPLFWKAAYRNLNEKKIIYAHNVLHCLSILCFIHTMYCTVCLSYASCTQCTAPVCLSCALVQRLFKFKVLPKKIIVPQSVTWYATKMFITLFTTASHFCLSWARNIQPTAPLVLLL
jgi:hypothetical protein